MEIQKPILSLNQRKAIQEANNPSQTNTFITEEDISQLEKTLSTSWTIGSNDDAYYTLLANTRANNNPGLRYSKATQKWQVSNDGLAWADVPIGNFFNKTTDTTDNITEGLNKFLNTKSIQGNHVNSINSPADKYLLGWDSGTSKFKWLDPTTATTPPVDNTIGTPPDGTYLDGLYSLTSTSNKSEVFDLFNEALKDLAPEQAPALTGGLQTTLPLYSGLIPKRENINSFNLITYTEGQNISNIVYSNTFLLPLPIFGKADVGELRLYLDGILIDTFNLGTHFNSNLSGMQQVYPPVNSTNNFIRILSVGKYNNFKLWQAGEAQIQIGSIYGNSNLSKGEHYYQVKHYIGSEVYGETSIERIFCDAETQRPSIQNLSVEEYVINFKYLSGIKYYGFGSVFKSNFEASKLFEYTYREDDIRFEGTGLNSFSMDIDDPAVTGVSTIPYNNEVLTCTGKEILLNKHNESSNNASFYVVPIDPKGDGTPANVNNTNRMIDTYSDLSTDTREYFVDEKRRLPLGDYNTIPTIINQWTSSQILVNGNAQVGDNKLFYPSSNYSAFLPTQNIDYTSFIGDQVYIRAFKDSIQGHSSGTLQFVGLAYSDLNVNAKVEIKLPGKTGWLDLGTSFNAGTFTGVDGDGCLILYSGNSFSWSVGTLTTEESGRMIIVKISLINTNKQIDYIEAFWN